MKLILRDSAHRTKGDHGGIMMMDAPFILLWIGTLSYAKEKEAKIQY